MAAVLVAIAVMGVLMSVALPVWRHQSQRDKETELVFRGEQWVRGLQQYQRRAGPGAAPPTLDLLVQQRFVRKKWKDPITGEDFVPVYAGQQPQPGRGGTPGQGRGAQPPAVGQQGAGGVIGVRSKSTENSIRLYKGATRYDQWQFLATNIGGPGGPGRGGPGGGGSSTRPGIGEGRGGRGGRGGGAGGAAGPRPGGQSTRPPGGGGAQVPRPPGG